MVERTNFRSVIYAIAFVVGVIVFGSAGYLIIQPELRAAPLDAAYMAVITVTTIGFREMGESTPASKFFTICLALLGVGAFLNVVTVLTNFGLARELGKTRSKRRMEKRIAAMHDHYILCGYGRTGQQVSRELAREHTAFVVVDNAAAAVGRASGDGYAVLSGDASDDAVLREAGVDRARGLISTLDHDDANLMVVLTARNLNSKLNIVTRANQERSEAKLQIAGADRVISPYGITGRRLAQLALRPHVVEFLEYVLHDQEVELWMEEVIVAIGSELAGKSLSESDVRQRLSINIVAVRQSDGRLAVMPMADTRLHPGDVLVALGSRENLGRLRELAGIANGGAH